MKLRVSFYYVGNIQEATQVYSHFLRCSPRFSSPDWVQFHVDGGELALHLDPNLEKTEENAPIRFGAVVSFNVPEIQQALMLAKQEGFRQVGNVQIQTYGKQVEVRDPWGNRISLVEVSTAR